MLRLAKFIVQHKFGFIAAVALGVVFFAPETKEQPASSNPWSVSAEPSYAVAEDRGMVDQIVDKADAMLAESGMDPRDTAEAAVGRFDDTASQYESANAD